MPGHHLGEKKNCRTVSLAMVTLVLVTAGPAAAGQRRSQQIASLDHLYYRLVPPPSAGDSRVAGLPGPTEREAYMNLRQRIDPGALELLTGIYRRRDLQALALRDSDGDGIPDFRISDYFGKFSEGDIDVDGDGVRNIYDAGPFDPRRGGQDSDGDGVPDGDGSFRDQNGNGLPDHLDWALSKELSEMAAYQLGLFRDHGIILVERDAVFDLELSRAVDDTVRRVFRRQFGAAPVLATLRTIAVEKTALLSAKLAAREGDNTGAQVISQTQSLVIYDEGRKTGLAIALLGLLVHEIGHSYQFSLDYDSDDPAAENRRNDFPAPRFLEEVAPFGWTTDGYDEDRRGGDPGFGPQFLYSGISEPIYLLDGKSPEWWEEWLGELYLSLDESPDYLRSPIFAETGVVGDYSLSNPWEWHSDNLLAYVILTLEEHLRRRGTLSVPGLSGGAAITAAEERITLSLREIWPAFNHRNIAGTDALAYFEEHFPISDEDREVLAQRYLLPLVGRTAPARPRLR